MPCIKKSHKSSVLTNGQKSPAITRISIIDGHRAMVKAVARHIEFTPGLQVASIYHNAEDALKTVVTDNPDIVLMEILLPDTNVPEGLDCMIRLKQQLPETAFLIFTMDDRDELLLDAIKFGAAGYILKTDGPVAAVRAIQEYQSGGFPLSKIPAHLFSLIKQEGFSKLTDLQNKILKLLAQGFSNVEIADRLDISQSAHRQHLHKIYRLLQANNRTELVNLWRKFHDEE